jgi:DNA-binding transcriptional LysR family regulator
MPQFFQPQANRERSPILPVYSAMPFFYRRADRGVRYREPESTLLTQEIRSVDSGNEIDFRAVESLHALASSLRVEEFRAMSDLVEFRHLKYIAALAEAGNFTRAAEQLFLSQPSLSKQIKDIEDEMGFPIFVRAREGVRTTPSGQMMVAYAQEMLAGRTEIITMARAVHRGDIPPLRLGFSSFIDPKLLQIFRDSYARMFPKCPIHLSGGITSSLLQRLEQGSLDGAILPMPIEGSQWVFQQISRDPLVVCMRTDDPLAREVAVSISDLALRLRIFRVPEIHRSAHERLIEMLIEVGIEPEVSCSAATPADIQLMVRSGYRVALIDQKTVLDPDLTTRPVSGVHWTADTAFVHHGEANHLALPFVIRFAQNMRKGTPDRKHPSKTEIRPRQLELLA